MKTTIVGFLKSVLISLLILGSAQVLAGGPQTEKTDQTVAQNSPKPTVQKVNLNTASLNQLIELPRIGPAIAQRIIDFREQHGGFKKLTDVMNVKGIGPKTFERLSDLISI